MLLHSSSQSDDPVSADQSRQHEQRQRRNEDGLETAAHAAQRQRKDDPRQSLHPCCAQVLAGDDQGRVQLFDRIEDRQDHERQLDVGRHENETEVREEDLLGTDAHEAQKLVDRPALTEQTDEGIGLQQEVDPCRQNDQGQPELLMLRPAQEKGRRVTDQERREGDGERIQERIQRHPQIISRTEIGRVVGKRECSGDVEKRLVQDQQHRREDKQPQPKHVRNRIERSRIFRHVSSPYSS